MARTATIQDKHKICAGKPEGSKSEANMTELEIDFWNLNPAKDSLLWRKRRSIARDRALKQKHPELNLDVFWLLVENKYLAITEKALQLLLQFSTSYMCEFGFSAVTTIKHMKREWTLPVDDELQVSISNIHPWIQLLCRNHRAQVSHWNVYYCKLMLTDNNKTTK